MRLLNFLIFVALLFIIHLLNPQIRMLINVYTFENEVVTNFVMLGIYISIIALIIISLI